MKYTPGTFLKLRRDGGLKVIKIKRYHSGGRYPWYDYNFINDPSLDLCPVAANDVDDINENAEPLSAEERRLVALLYE